MDWLWLRMHWATLTFWERVRVIGMVLLVLTFLFTLVLQLPMIRQTNFGFGPDWDCVGLPKAGAYCVKRIKDQDAGGCVTPGLLATILVKQGSHRGRSWQ